MCRADCDSKQLHAFANMNCLSAQQLGETDGLGGVPSSTHSPLLPSDPESAFGGQPFLPGAGWGASRQVWPLSPRSLRPGFLLPQGS